MMMLMMSSKALLLWTVYHLECWGGYGVLLIAVDIVCCCFCSKPIQTQMMLATSGAEFADDDVNDVVGGFSSWTVYHLRSWGGYIG